MKLCAYFCTLNTIFKKVQNENDHKFTHENYSQIFRFLFSRYYGDVLH
ncbi:putative phage abortive infection protein [Maribacter aquivivus]